MRSRFPKRLQKKAKWEFKGYPLGTVAFYGPDNRFASKVTVAVIPTGGGKTAKRRADPDRSQVAALMKMAAGFVITCSPKAGDCCVFCS